MRNESETLCWLGTSIREEKMVNDRLRCRECIVYRLSSLREWVKREEMKCDTRLKYYSSRRPTSSDFCRRG